MEEKLKQHPVADKDKLNQPIEVLQKVDSSDTVGSNQRDLLLWAKIRKGETQALGDLYDQYIDFLFPYGITLCGDKTLVMDAVHDLFVDLYKYRKKLADKPQVKYYLLKSLKRKIYKKSGKKSAAFDTMEESRLIHLNLFEASVEKNIIDLENDVDQKQRVSRALEGLPKKQKKAVYLKFYEGKSYEEIAGLMNVSIPTSRTLIYRSLLTLRKILSVLLVMQFYFFLSARL